MLSTIIVVVMCTVVINVLDLGAFNVETQYFIPLFNTISSLCGRQLGGDEASNEGCNSRPTRYDFTHNFTTWNQNYINIIIVPNKCHFFSFCVFLSSFFDIFYIFYLGFFSFLEWKMEIIIGTWNKHQSSSNNQS